MTVSAPSIRIRDLAPDDRDWADALISAHQGLRMTARLGELLDPLELDGLVAEASGERVGLATVHETPGGGFELLTLHADPRGTGAGSALLQTALQVAGATGHTRLWLVTTNDNLDAIRFYLRRGMRVARVHAGAVARDRALKPEIPAVNPDNGLPIRDLVELELPAAGVDAVLERVAFPRIADLDRLPIEAFVNEAGVLFEGAPRFLERLAAARPFETDADLIASAGRIARELPAEEAIELVNAHPRIGAAPASVSTLSHAEQGYDEEPDPYADREAARVAEELEFLNEAYERIHGFRFAVFVAGRSRADIVPLLEVGLRNETDAELRRAADECVDIAADRLARLRAA
ncbi:MAG TPA: GNAT family N-acetyltransferase [Candidatus Limnocylindria bacterium]|nr:GNAT family N-acetyltransferase [Candidatus Limnocylindria bacterium]